ncbi:MAG: hypothetical protein WA989_13925, partial [Henriciella sp.]|uniref:hypothetical protein n=1 Tax=Henriciella sp. TaxID=1968823 RepID=UPI003C747416
MLVRISIVVAFLSWSACAAQADPIIEFRSQLETKCETALASAREELSNNWPDDAPIVEKLSIDVVLQTAEDHFKYSKTADQRQFDDNDVLACRTTLPGAACKPPAEATATMDHGYKSSVLFAADKPAGEIRKALLYLFNKAKASDWVATEPTRSVFIQPVWSAAICVDAPCSGTSMHKTRSSRFVDAASRPNGKEQFDFESVYVADYIGGRPSIAVYCVGPRNSVPFDDTVSNPLMTAVDDVFVAGASISDQVASTILPTYEAADDHRPPRREEKPLAANPTPISAAGAKPKKNEDTEFTRGLMIVKDPSQFAQAKPKGVEIGADVSADGSESAITLDLALGLTFGATDKWAACKRPLPARTDGGCEAISGEGGGRRLYSLFAAYSQAPSSEILYNRDILQFDLDETGVRPSDPFDPTLGEFPTKKEPF